MQTVRNAVSVHTRISKGLLRSTDLAALNSATTRSDIINRALKSYFATAKTVTASTTTTTAKPRSAGTATTSKTKARTRTK